VTKQATGTNVRYGDEMQILGTYTVSTDVDTDRFSGEAAQSVARDYMSSGTVGAVLAELATTGRCSLTALLEDIRATTRQLCYPGGNSIAARHSANLDNLSLWAFQVAVEVFDTAQCATCGEDIMDDRKFCADCDEENV
jgi:hypothetical protein